jgi:nucleoside phosphorylase
MSGDTTQHQNGHLERRIVGKMNEILLLSDEPQQETDATITLDILSSDGSATRGTRLIQKKELAGKITLNPERCPIFFLSPPADTASSQALTPDRMQWDLYLINIPFTLHKALGESYYEEMAFFVEMANQNVTAFDLFPKHITTDVEAKTYILSPHLTIAPAETGIAQIGKHIRFTSLHPTITAFGEGEHSFYWVYEEAQEQKGVIPETKQALMVLQVPRGTSSITATISYETVIVRQVLGMWRHRDGTTETRQIQWDLTGAPAFHEMDNVQALVEQRQIGEKATTSGNTYFDVCVVCALAEEAQAFMQITTQQYGVQFDKVFDKHLNLEYYITQFPNSLGELLKLQVSWLPACGPVETSLHLKLFLTKFRPHFAAMTGICAGNKEKAQLGDLIVADCAYFYDSGKFVLDRSGEQVHMHNPDVYRVNKKVKHFIQMFERWKSTIAPMEPKCHIGAIASGSAVRADRPFERIPFQLRNTLAIDMEGAAFYRTVEDFPGMDALLVKGVSDYADDNKDDSSHWHASAVSAAYMLAFIQEYVTAERMPSVSTT